MSSQKPPPVMSESIEPTLQDLENRRASLHVELTEIHDEIASVSYRMLTATASDMTRLISDRVALENRRGKLEAALSKIRAQVMTESSGNNLLDGYVVEVQSKAETDAEGKARALPRSAFETVRTSTREES